MGASYAREAGNTLDHSLRLDFFDTYAAALRARGWEVILTARPQSIWSVQRYKLRQVDLDFRSEGAPTIVAGTSPSESIILAVLTRAPPSGQLFNGHRIHAFDMIVLPPMQKFIQASPGPHQWTSCLISRADLQQFEPSMRDTFHALSQLREPVVLRSPTLAKQITSIASEIDRLKKSENRSQAQFDELEQSLVDAISTAFSVALERCDPAMDPPLVRRTRSFDFVYGIVHIFNNSGNVRRHVADFCRALDATDRQVRRSFHTYFAMGPAKLSRMHHVNRVRHILIDRTAQGESVMDVLSVCEVTEPGRFAGEYKALFGETPSETKKKRLADARHQFT